MQRNILHISCDANGAKEGPSLAGFCALPLPFNGVMHRSSLSGKLPLPLPLLLQPATKSFLFLVYCCCCRLCLQNNLQIAGQKMAPQSSPESRRHPPPVTRHPSTPTPNTQHPKPDTRRLPSIQEQLQKTNGARTQPPHTIIHMYV